MLKTLTESHFKPGDSYSIENVGEEALALTVKETKSLGEGTERRAFSVVFGGPEDPFLPQAIYQLKHKERGELGLFLVPLGPGGDDGEFLYEAVFN